MYGARTGRGLNPFRVEGVTPAFQSIPSLRVEDVRPGKSLLRGNAQRGAKGKVGESPTGGAREIAQRLPRGGLLDDGNTVSRE